MDYFYLQQRINFPEIKKKIRIEATLQGMTVILDCNKYSDLLLFFKKNGINYEIDDLSRIKVSLQVFMKLFNFTHFLDIVCDSNLKVLQKISLNPPINDSFITVTLENNEYIISWISENNTKFIEHVGPRNIALLVPAGLPFNAPTDTWISLKKDTNFPFRAGVAKKDSSSFIKIYPYSENLVRTLDIPGVFKVSNSLYGASIFSLNHIKKCDNLIIESSLNEYNGLEIFTEKKDSLSDESAVGNLLKIHKGRVVITRSFNDLSKIKKIMSVVEGGSLYPCLIVCANESVPLWFFGIKQYTEITPSLTDKYAQIRIVSYDYFKVNKNIKTPVSVIFDNLEVELTAPASSGLTTRFAGATETTKLALINEEQSGIDVYKFVMPIVSPEEFPPGKDLNLRYIGDPDKSFLTHAGFYISTLQGTESGPGKLFIKSVTLPKQISEEIVLIKNKTPSQLLLLSKISDLIACGANSFMSPKISECLQIFNENYDKFKHFYIISSSPQFLEIFNLLARSSLNKSKNNYTLCSLQDFHAYTVEENSLIISTNFLGKNKTENLLNSGIYIRIVHASGTIDDKLAVMSVIKSDFDFITGNYNPAELDWILN